MHLAILAALAPASLALAPLGSVLGDFIHSPHFFLAIGGLLVFVIVAWQRRRDRPVYVHLAERLGFHFQEGKTRLGFLLTFPTIEGRHRGRTIQFGPQADPFALNRKPEQRPRLFSVTAKFSRATDFQLYVLPNFSLSRRRPKHLEEAPTGDAEFDRLFLVSSNDPAKARSLLTPKIREEFLAARQVGGPRFSQRALETSALHRLASRPNIRGPSLAIENGEVSYLLRRPWNLRFKLQDRLDHLVGKMDFVCDLAERIEG